MKAYISVSFSNRKSVDNELTTIANTLNEFKITPFIFVDNYKFEPSQEKQMMQQAMIDLEHCDMLIAETSNKGIGVGIEVGYAKAKGKPVIYARKKDAEHSTTTSGICDFQIIYEGTSDLHKQLSDVLNKLVASK